MILKREAAKACRRAALRGKAKKEKNYGKKKKGETWN